MVLLLSFETILSRVVSATTVKLLLAKHLHTSPFPGIVLTSTPESTSTIGNVLSRIALVRRLLDRKILSSSFPSPTVSAAEGTGARGEPSFSVKI